jgi:hypothetical protein
LQGKKICVRGAAHSFPLIATLEEKAATANNIYVLLSKMNAVTIDQPNSMVAVQAGCHLGVDPFDPTGISTLQNSLLYQINQEGMALGDLGGITHQTVGGFLSTGSSGGSTQFNFEDALMSVDVITCGSNSATKVTYSRPVPDNPDDPFYAVAVAGIGLMGIITSATFKCIATFNISGSETTTSCDDCEIDLFGPGNGKKLSFSIFLSKLNTQGLSGGHRKMLRNLWYGKPLVLNQHRILFRSLTRKFPGLPAAPFLQHFLLTSFTPQWENGPIGWEICLVQTVKHSKK